MIQEDYFIWKQKYENSDHNSAIGYLRSMQRLYSEPLFESSKFNRIFSQARQKQMPDKINLKTSDFFIDETPHVYQTYYLQKIIYDPIIQSVSDDIKDIIQNIPIGVLPTRSVNACVMLTPGGPIIIMDSGLLNMISFFTESNLISGLYEMQNGKQYIDSQNQFIIDYYNKKGMLNFPLPQDKYKLTYENSFALLLQNVCCEAYIICHEIAHIVLGHLVKDKTLKLSMSSDELHNLKNINEPKIYTYSQVQEFEADYEGYKIFNKIFFKLPPFRNFKKFVNTHKEIIQTFKTECFYIFHLMHLIELNCEKYRDITTHPPAKERLKSLCSRLSCEHNTSSLSDEQLLQDLFFEHNKILDDMPIYDINNTRKN
ncbi:MAG: hypothetical protein HQK79_21990 [Desulfobacterales bacterium]|nr:hypothetical protein [Desulfobacterales bacterium]